MKDLVFVYGTLKAGFHNHLLLDGAKYLGEFTTDKNYTMVHLGGFPGVINAGKTPIQGEVYEVNSVGMAALDRLEGYPSLYSRKRISTTYGEAWMYIYNNTANRPMFPIDEGVWTPATRKQGVRGV